jgi:hypothetical protein
MGDTHLVLPVLDHGRRPCLGRLEKRKEELVRNERLRQFDQEGTQQRAARAHVAIAQLALVVVPTAPTARYDALTQRGDTSFGRDLEGMAQR